MVSLSFSLSISLSFDFDFLVRDGLDDGILGDHDAWILGTVIRREPIEKIYLHFGIFCASRSSFWIRQRIYLGFRERIKINWD